MYVYINSNSEPGLYTVGFYNPQGLWEAESDHTTPEKAAERVNYLNGGRTKESNVSPAELREFAKYLFMDGIKEEPFQVLVDWLEKYSVEYYNQIRLQIKKIGERYYVVK